MRSILFPTPLHRDLAVDIDDGRILASSWQEPAMPIAQAPKRKRGDLQSEIFRQIDAYFARRLTIFDLPLFFNGSAFEISVWQAVATIPFGMSVSYGRVASVVGRPGAHRGVARAMAQLNFALFVPAHRVVGADGKVKGAEPGSIRLQLLDFEGEHTQNDFTFDP